MGVQGGVDAGGAERGHVASDAAVGVGALGAGVGSAAVSGAQASPASTTCCGCFNALTASHNSPGSRFVLVGIVVPREPWLIVDLYPRGCTGTKCTLSLCPSLSFSRLTRLTQVCKSWRRELETRGFCRKTVQLCSVLAGGGDAESLLLKTLLRLDASSGDDIERAEGGAFLEKSLSVEGSLPEWLQAASQEPDASFLSRGAASTAQCLGLALVPWVGKPQGRYPGAYALAGHSYKVQSVSLSPDGKRAASASDDRLVKIWNTETGAEVSSLE